MTNATTGTTYLACSYEASGLEPNTKSGLEPNLSSSTDNGSLNGFRYSGPGYVSTQKYVPDAPGFPEPYGVTTVNVAATETSDVFDGPAQGSSLSFTIEAANALGTTYTLLTTHYSLLTTHYSLLTTCYSLLTMCYSPACAPRPPGRGAGPCAPAMNNTLAGTRA